MSHDLTRWIENAEARRYHEAALYTQWQGGERHYLHLGGAVAHLPSWLRRGVSRETLTAIGCQTLSYLRLRQD